LNTFIRARAPNVFLDDTRISRLWTGTERAYLLVEGPSVERIRTLVKPAALHLVKESGGKSLYVNHLPGEGVTP